MLHGDVLGERTSISPGRTALVEVATGRRFTYSELDHRASACARALLDGLEVRPGDRVGVLSGNRVELLDLFFVAGKSGVIVVPLNTRLTARELEGIGRDCGFETLVFDGERSLLAAELGERVRLRHRVALDGPVGDGERSYRELVAAHADRPLIRGRCHPEDPYCLLYTSGTTGRPKGVMISHRQVAWNAVNTVLNWQLSEVDVSPVFTPVYHAGGLGAFLMPIIAAGGTVVLHAGFDAGEVWRTIERERCTVALGVPTIWKLLAEAPEFATVDLSHVRWFISGGAPLPRSVIDLYRDRGVVLRQGYGLTEVGVNCFAMSDEEAWSKAGSIGRPLMFTRARLVDGEGREVAEGEVGELQFEGPHVCAGYWGDPDTTAAALDAEGWFSTGDLARRDADGFYFIAGRRKDMFISGGVNVYPAEVENELLQHPHLRDAAVVGVPHPTWGEVGVAFVVPAGEGTIRTDELGAFLAGRLARFKVPREFIVVAELPRTPYGKVVKGELVQRYFSAHPGGTP
jgi:fatty-acyl-CoA synthase